MKRYIFFNRIMDYIFILMGLYGMAELFLSAFELELFGGMYILVLAVVCLAAYWIHLYFSKTVYRYFMIVTFVLWLLLGFLLKSFLLFSFYGLVEEMNLGIHYENSIQYSLFIVYIVMILNILYLYFYFNGIKAAYLLLPAPLLFDVFFNRMPSSISIVLVIVSVVCSSLYQNPEEEKKRLFYPVGVAVAAVLLFGLTDFFVPSSEYENKEGFLIKWVNQLGEKQEDKEESFVAAGGINGGKLGEYDVIEIQNVKMLTFITGYTGDIYLRSFIGAVYHQNCWDKLSDEIYINNKKIFDGSIYNIDIYNQPANLYTIIDQDEELVSFLYGDLKNYFTKVGNRKYYVNFEPRTNKEYWYMPYGNTYYVSNKSTPDSYPLHCKEGKIAGRQYVEKDINYDDLTSFLADYDGTNAKLNQYRDWEKQYREFVYKNYTNQRTDYKDYVDSSRVPVPQFSGNIHRASDKLAFADTLKAYFEENFDYSLKTGALKENEDFVQRFLTSQTQGYCTHFASAAAIILRNAGIPARYVEGFHIQSNAFKASEMKECTDIIEKNDFRIENKYNLYTIPVLDGDAHAWTEIYMDGYGWIPLEFTPSYTAHVTMEEGMMEVKDKEEVDTPIVEETKSNTNDSNQPTSYDTIEEYMKHNPTNRIDFSIVLPIIGKNLLKAAFSLFLCILFLLGLAVCFFIPTKYLEIKKRSLFQINEKNTPQEDKEQVIAVYQYVEKICRFLKINYTKDMTCSDLTKACIQYDDFFQEAHIEYIMYAIEKISFGHGNIGKAEMKNTIDALCKIHDECYRKQGKIGKIRFRYIWHLY